MAHPLDKIIFDTKASAFDRIKAVVARLRDPNGGCPWDLEQTHETLTPYVIEEAHEVVDAIRSGSRELPAELGDLLLQVMLHSQIASEEKRFSIDDVMERASAKMIKRHPHVFGEVDAKSASQVLKNWEQIKQKDLKEGESILDGVPKGMPALLRAQRISEKAARVGFEWATLDEIKEKVYEEIKEFNDECHEGADTKKIEDEFGDILFALTQVARRMNMNAEDLLQRSSDKFTRRFKEMEKRAGRRLSEMTLTELDVIWEEIKAEEKSSPLS